MGHVALILQRMPLNERGFAGQVLAGHQVDEFLRQFPELMRDRIYDGVQRVRDGRLVDIRVFDNIAMATSEAQDFIRRRPPNEWTLFYVYSPGPRGSMEAQNEGRLRGLTELVFTAADSGQFPYVECIKCRWREPTLYFKLDAAQDPVDLRVLDLMETTLAFSSARSWLATIELRDGTRLYWALTDQSVADTLSNLDDEEREDFIRVERQRGGGWRVIPLWAEPEPEPIRGPRQTDTGVAELLVKVELPEDILNDLGSGDKETRKFAFGQLKEAIAADWPDWYPLVSIQRVTSLKDLKVEDEDE